MVIGLLATKLVDIVAIFTTIAAVIVWAALVPVSRHMPRKTATGAEAAAKWRAFRRYLVSLTEQRDLPEAASVFDRYLSYAVAFRIDRQWIEAFSRAGARAPGWFGMPEIGDVGDVVVVGDMSGAGRALGDIGGAIGSAGVPDVSLPDVSMPDVQGLADTLGGSLQGASDGLSGLLDLAGSIFDGIDFDL